MHQRWLAALTSAGLGLAAACSGSDLTLPSDGRPAALAIVAGNEQTAAPGELAPGPLIVQVSDADRRPVRQVPVAFVVTGGGGATAPDTALTGDDGRASSRWTFGGSRGAQAVEARVVGSDGIRATFLGMATTDGQPGGGAAATATRITSVNPSPSFPTQPVAVAFEVTSAAGTPTGTVTVGDGAASCSGAAPVGQCTLAFTIAGSTTLTARYSGSSAFAPSSGTTQHQVTLAPTSTTLASSKNPSKKDESVTFTARVRSSFRTPDGSVHFVEGSCEAPSRAWGMRSLDGSGTASLTIPTLSPGAHPILACYLGTGIFAASASDVLNQEVSKKGHD
jgi:Big-like domain-containing protein